MILNFFKRMLVASMSFTVAWICGILYYSPPVGFNHPERILGIAMIVIIAFLFISPFLNDK